MERQLLISYGTLGSGLMVADSIKIDEPIDHNFKLTDNEISTIQTAIDLGLETFIDTLEEAEERIAEYHQLWKKVDHDIKQLNEKYRMSKFIKFDFDSNLYQTIHFVNTIMTLMGQWAVLFTEDIEKFNYFDNIISEFHLDVMMKYRASHSNSHMFVLDENYKTFGAAARNGYSIFDLAVHHYKHIFKNKKETLNE